MSELLLLFEHPVIHDGYKLLTHCAILGDLICAKYVFKTFKSVKERVEGIFDCYRI